MSPLYFMMAILFFKLIKLLRLTLVNYLQDPISLIFSIYILTTIISKFTYKLWGLSGDFFTVSIGHTAVLMGIGFALYRKIYLNFYEE